MGLPEADGMPLVTLMARALAPVHVRRKTRFNVTRQNKQPSRALSPVAIDWPALTRLTKASRAITHQGHALRDRHQTRSAIAWRFTGV
jgi:hypothetical protein